RRHREPAGIGGAVAPAAHLAPGGERAGEVVASDEIDRRGGERHATRAGGPIGLAPELTARPVAPAEDLVLGGEGAGVIAPDRETTRDDAGHGERDGAVGGALAQLAPRAGAPAADGAVVAPGTTGVMAASDGVGGQAGHPPTRR